jgi:hypothetical protein
MVIGDLMKSKAIALVLALFRLPWKPWMTKPALDFGYVADQQVDVTEVRLVVEQEEVLGLHVVMH